MKFSGTSMIVRGTLFTLSYRTVSTYVHTKSRDKNSEAEFQEARVSPRSCRAEYARRKKLLVAREDEEGLNPP